MKNASRHDTSASLAVMAAGRGTPAKQPDKEGLEPQPTGPTRENGRADTVSSELAGPRQGLSNVIRFDGQSAADNRRVLGFAFVPPDTNGAVGASQFVQMVNVTIAVYSKRDGGPLVLASGGGVQVNSFKRWGDYSSMTIDPRDDCTFWYTQEYYLATGSFNWATRIGAFKFDRCKPSTK